MYPCRNDFSSLESPFSDFLKYSINLLDCVSKKAHRMSDKKGQLVCDVIFFFSCLMYVFFLLIYVIYYMHKSMEYLYLLQMDVLRSWIAFPC